MLITDDLFEAFILCETKAHLKHTGADGALSEFLVWQGGNLQRCQQRCGLQLRASVPANECLPETSTLADLKRPDIRLFLNCTVEADNMEAKIDAIERLPSPDNPHAAPLMPIRFIPGNKVTSHDRLRLAYSGYVLSKATANPCAVGKIIHGEQQIPLRVKLADHMKTVISTIEKMENQFASTDPPALILNRHCPECLFQQRCRERAIEKDELTLLGGLPETERKKQHSKGIFTVTQLSYTFRARRRTKGSESKPQKYNPALRALAIRTNTIHIAGKPGLKINGSPVYLDVEGDPDRDLYYLIGLRFKRANTFVQHSFWADDAIAESEIWVSFLRTLTQIEDPQLLHYGSYETAFLKRMHARYGEPVEKPGFLDRLIANALNVLAVIYAQIYFPTYSNGLKEVARHLGFEWSERSASGLNASVWRYQWENSRDPGLKDKLISYNAEDCEALERVTMAVTQLCQRQTDTTKPAYGNVAYTDSMKRDGLENWGKPEFVLPEMEHINEAAYWDYQRERVYVRSSKRLKRVFSQSTTGREKPPPINKVSECKPPTCCPQCGAGDIHKRGRGRKLVYDLKFSHFGVRRWIVKYLFGRYTCNRCGASFVSQPGLWTRSKYGSDLCSYMIYQLIEVHLSLTHVAKHINQLFGFDLRFYMIARQKRRASELYSDTYERILHRIVSGRLVHADETRISINGRESYVWVFASLEEVIYLYAATREGDVLDILKGFEGVLVSDFYPAYDSVDCPQQKCLIHLIRDMNDDLLQQPFNEEYKGFAQEFTFLLRSIVDTVDRFGLKARFLHKHKVHVTRFFERLSARECKTEVMVRYKKRFEKNQDKLFTFLDYDGIPWNNNNAECAVKRFAALRRVIGGNSSVKGIREYLMLLSICETCKCKGASFLDFLRSGEKDIDEFIEKTRHRRNLRVM